MGGLSVRAEIARALPAESLIYFGDGKNVPYGPRSKAEIVGFVEQAVEMLISLNIKLLVVACNAATGAAIDYLRAKYDIPIIGMEPAVKPAAMSSKSGTIGVLATAAAFKGDLYRATSDRFRPTTTILEVVGEGFVELVENDLEGTSEALETVRRAVEPILEKGADKIVLGCTHYPFLVPEIRAVIGSRDVQIIDSAPAIARRVGQILRENGLETTPAKEPRHEFRTFADKNYLEHLIEKSKKL